MEDRGSGSDERANGDHGLGCERTALSLFDHRPVAILLRHAEEINSTFCLHLPSLAHSCTEFTWSKTRPGVKFKCIVVLLTFGRKVATVHYRR